jgi:non-ribosomal peptide synthetase component F
MSAFRTGDLGMRRADGCVIHMGRKDDLVKIRGHRVSLVEVDNALLQIEGVARATSRTFPTANDDNRLVGYVVADAAFTKQLTPEYLRSTLAKRVPDPVIPAHVVVLDALPMTASGKPDRKALPKPGNPRPALETPFRAPSNDLERELCALWAKRLEVDEVGLDDNFFLLGGDSMLMTMVLLEIEKTWKKSVSGTFFNEPTVAEMTRQMCDASPADIQAP